MKEDKKVKNILQKYMQWPLVMAVLVICGNVAAALVSVHAGAVMTVFTVLYLICAFVVYWYGKKKIMTGLVTYAAEYFETQKQLFSAMDLPYGIADEEGRLLWMNRALFALVKDEKTSHRSLPLLFEEITEEFLSKAEHSAEVHSTYNEAKYRIVLKRFGLSSGEGLLDKKSDIQEDQDLFAVYFYDETEIHAYMQAITDQKMVAGLIYLDNYDEALESVEEVRRSLLVALIDRKINKYISSLNGILKKLEKDKYFFMIKQKYVERIEADRFNILEEVKTVNIGNEMSVTLSIGLGMNGDTYIQNYEYARTAIDMALGRGGDQAVVKDGGKIQYYGGKSQQLEKTTRVKARVKAHALRELLETKDRLLIMGHKIGDIDSFGAAIGMYRIATALNKRASIVINEVTSSVRPTMDRFLENSDYPEDLFLTGDQAADTVDANTALVVVDVNRPSYTEAPELLKLVKTIVVIDHHRQSSEIITNATLSYVEPYASSACEMVAEILQYVADSIRMKSQEADAMYAGIVIDTNNFTNQAGVRTFEAAAFLRRNGADVTRVRKLFRDKMEDYKARAEAVRQAEVFEDAFAISVCPSEGLESPTVVGAQAANELLDIVGIKASVVLTPYEGKIYVSARSIDEINVQVMMEKLGGGGHRTIAGAQLLDMTVEEAKEKVREIIKKMREKGEF